MNTKEMYLKRDILDRFIESQKISYTELLIRIQRAYGIELTYKSFMHLISNRASWKLLYAFALSEHIKVPIPELFELK